ncbi:penicillin-binding protein 1C [Hymenobacter sp. 15J16-1T3B]|uniref:penicillin-binding protein 1C n=1 Tax=Hymenobacter sp. 15J16-1T3B TaxID=2886941 RepID=UPI001D108889|nr:penicillin-binding protein 1C [Hymenobacter sp. 15J16-1T3B]MCC3158143.1 penicillin-binding protein 1C [Hymenobacter sp. 15J16-1T3B]
MNRRLGLRLLRGSGLLLLLLGGLDWLFPLPPLPPASPVVLAADGSVLHAYLSPDQKWRLPAGLHDITPALRRALVAKEDRWFYWHPGVNPVALVKSAGRNVLGRGRRSGASTITMQVARLLEPKERTVGGKLQEMLRALQLEAYYSKDEILQLYLNLVPYGSNVEGVKSAALLYYGQPPHYLSLAQTVTLTIVPNNPTGLAPGRHNAALLAARNRWLRRLGAEGVFPAPDVENALHEPLLARRRPAPRLAPHLARRLVQDMYRAAGRPADHLAAAFRPSSPLAARRALLADAGIRSALVRTAQAKAEDLTRQYVRRLAPLGITQAAVLVVDNRTRAVQAYVGSADFLDGRAQGQVDGIRAVRSPGSTLKPFLYAVAMDRGLVTPKRVLPDVPTNFGGFRPENFDKHCQGEVTLERALAFSLNIPAVHVLQQVGVGEFAGQLRRAGFRTVARQAPQLGLSTILGGCGASLEELVGLYSALANEGVYGPLRFTAGAAPQTANEPANTAAGPTPAAVEAAHRKASGAASLPTPTFSSLRTKNPGTRSASVTSAGEVRLVSESAAYLVTDILSQLVRPDLPVGHENALRLPHIAWKTGTSYGRRDAWSIGYNRHYTIGVWVGNFTGQGAPALTGTDVATPLLFDLFNALSYNDGAEWYAPPAGLDFRLVCPVSGQVPGEFCPDQVMDYFLPGLSDVRRCEHQQEVFVAADGAVSYCRACLPAAGYRRVLYPNFAPEVLAFKAAQGLPHALRPPHNPACTLVRAADAAPDQAPRILSPTPNAEYVLDARDSQQLQLRCAAWSDVRLVYWYANDQFVRAAAPTEAVFIRPAAGPLKISCADDHGRNTNVQVLVERL